MFKHLMKNRVNRHLFTTSGGQPNSSLLVGCQFQLIHPLELTQVLQTAAPADTQRYPEEERAIKKRELILTKRCTTYTPYIISASLHRQVTLLSLRKIERKECKFRPILPNYQVAGIKLNFFHQCNFSILDSFIENQSYIQTLVFCDLTGLREKEVGIQGAKKTKTPQTILAKVEVKYSYT